MRRRKRDDGQRFGPRHAVVLLLGAGFGVVLLVAGLDRQHDHQVLASRGLTATALITKVHSGRGGPSVDVRFTTAGGQEVTARVEDAESPDGLYEGATIAVRYDPLDAARRIESASSGFASATAWFLIVSGVLLLALAAYGSAWWASHALTK